MSRYAYIYIYVHMYVHIYIYRHFYFLSMYISISRSGLRAFELGGVSLVVERALQFWSFRV